MQAADTCETTINISQTTKRHISEDAKLQPPVRPCSQSCQMAQRLAYRLAYRLACKVSKGNTTAWLRIYFRICWF
jgi:hypothetical protein